MQPPQTLHGAVAIQSFILSPHSVYNSCMFYVIIFYTILFPSCFLIMIRNILWKNIYTKTAEGKHSHCKKGSVFMSIFAQVQAKTYSEEDYYKLDENTRAELIDGQFYDLAAPSRIHQEILMFLSKNIANYIDTNSGSCRIYPAPFAVKLFDDTANIVEPDISVICDPNKLTDKGCSGAPDWIIEIASPTNPRHDYITKLNLYSNAGVREYWIVDPKYQKIHVYNMETDNFYVKVYSFDDTIKAGIWKDLYIDFSSFSLDTL